MQYKNYILDDFQVKAIEALERHSSVVVSAATGTGKTLIADYVITKFIKEGKRIVYTAPIKALSNQKFRDFTADFGSASVGLITGDVQYNQNAQLLIMTTEIFRNMLVSRDPIVKEVAYVIFDEIHFISDVERGTIWEESVIFSPEHIRFLCLSATIPNADEFAKWIETIKKHKVEVIRYAQRAVPLTHFFYDEEGFGLMTRDGLIQAKDMAHAPRYDKGKKRHRFERPKNPLNHITLIQELQNKEWLPCLFFVFSRDMCLRRAKDLAKVRTFLPREKQPIVFDIFKRTVSDEEARLESVRQVKELALKGIGVHHAGLLPKLKEFIELCFSKGLLQVLFATETFAVGINMPARCVCFASLQKYDGISFRYLNSKEYFQLAGRAGRRGIDKEGYAISMLEMGKAEVGRILKFTEADVDPIISQFGLSFNTALYLYKNYRIDEAEVVLKNSFDYFQKKMQGSHQRIMASYKNKLKLLKNLGYIDSNGLTSRGEVLQHIYSHELLLGELFTTKISYELEPIEIILLLGTMELEERKGEHFTIDKNNPLAGKIMRKISSSSYALKTVNKFDLKRLSAMISSWVKTGDFERLTTLATFQEGDLIHFFRRILDSLRQIRHATGDSELRLKLEKAMELIDKPPVRFEF